MKSRRKNPSSRNITIPDSRRQSPPQRILKERNTPPPSNNLVMGQVKILKRGEPLEQVSIDPVNSFKVDGELKSTSENGREFIATKKKATKHKMSSVHVLKDEDLVLSSTRRLGPDAGIVSKQMKMKMIEGYAGYGFVESPSPSLVPLPTFPIKKH
ncbi:hypothetical protein QVD17_11880 [Tagetes erecta]|uniref:Uncharacterized protein n=1 Tax=Tagetes erecta TaxID=13708 RepID=A0AAD8KYV7_TARER|nr:hypothetical protein QVD17_11880 [Tagetes erecta]